MLWNNDFLFLHIPKTAGKSLTKAFVQVLDRPITCFITKGQHWELFGHAKIYFKTDRDFYALCLENLKIQFDALMQSYRWKVGNALISLITMSKFKKNFLMSTDHMKRIFQRFEQFKSKQSQTRGINDLDMSSLTIIEGRGHENIIAARRILSEYDKTLESFKAIIVAIRNPYDLMVSNYFFMRKTYKYNQHRENFQIAQENNFEDYAIKVGFAPLENWMTIEGNRPQSLRIIRFENLQKDFDSLAQEFGFQSVKLPHINPSSHDHYSKYLTKTSEAAIYKKFKYLFDQGFYERHSFK